MVTWRKSAARYFQFSHTIVHILLECKYYVIVIGQNIFSNNVHCFCIPLPQCFYFVRAVLAISGKHAYAQYKE